MDGLAARGQPAEAWLIAGKRKSAPDDILAEIDVQRAGKRGCLAGDVAGSARIAAGRNRQRPGGSV